MPTTPQTLVDDVVANTVSAASNPKIETLPNGNFLVAYSTSIGGKGHFIHGQQLDVAANKIGGEISFVFDQLIEEPEFDIGVQPNGHVIVVAEVDDEDTALSFIDPGGQSSLSDIEAGTYQINGSGSADIVSSHRIERSPPSTTSFNPVLAVLDNEKYRVYFTRNTAGQDKLLETAIDSGTFDRRDVVLPFGGRADADLAADVLTNGNIITVLDRDSDKGFRAKIDFRIIDPTGSILKNGAVGAGARTFNPTVRALAEGGFVIAWAELDRAFAKKSRQDTDIYLQLFDANGNPTTGRILHADGNANDNNNEPAIAALEDGGFILFYDKDRGAKAIRGQRFDGTGQRVGDDFLVLPGNAGQIDATTLPGGRVAVACKNGRDIKVEILAVD